jgi:hypothetical protein
VSCATRHLRWAAPYRHVKVSVQEQAHDAGMPLERLFLAESLPQSKRIVPFTHRVWQRSPWKHAMDMSWQQHCSHNAARKYVCIINTYCRCHVMVQHIAPFSMLPHQAAYLARSPILQRHWCTKGATSRCSGSAMFAAASCSSRSARVRAASSNSACRRNIDETHGAQRTMA